MALGMLTACASIDTRDEASGEIERMNDSEISLDSGGTFVIPPDKRYLVEDLETGQPVTVMYKEENGQKVVQYIFRAM